MREILFRGKRIDNGKWVYGNYIKSPTCKNLYMIEDTEPTIMDNGCRCFQGCSVVDPATVGQYTGLTDKNGKKIFEGDIGRYRQTDGAKRNGAPILCTGRVLYNTQTASYAVESRDEAGCKYFDYLPIKDFEIIGNIHDNPELMEGTT